MEHGFAPLLYLPGLTGVLSDPVRLDERVVRLTGRELVKAVGRLDVGRFLGSYLAHVNGNRVVADQGGEIAAVEQLA